MTGYRRPAATIILLALVCLYAAGFGTLAVRAYPAHETGGAFDLGNHVQALRNAARGGGLSLTLVPEFGPTRFAMHVEPTLFLLAPVFRFITDDPRFLLWLQAVVIALGGLPLYALARRRLNHDWAALMLVAIYFLLPALESVTLFDFHAVGLAPTLMLSALYFLDRALITSDDWRGLWTKPPIGTAVSLKGTAGTRRQICLSGLFFLLALGTKEDISLNVFVFGLYLLLLRRRWRPGLVLSIVGLAWFYVAVYVIIPASRPAGDQSAYLGFFAGLGDTPLDILLSPFRTPGKVAALVTAPDVIRGIGMLTLPLALVPFIGWPYLVAVAPTLAITLLSENPNMHRLETYHYAAPAIPFLMLAAIDGVARLSGLIERYSHGRRPAIPLTRRNAVMIVVLVMLLASVVYHHYRGYSPLARPFHWPQVTTHQQVGDALAASIPPEAPVVAQAELVPLVASRPWVQIWQGPFDERADYFLLDVSHPAFVNRNGAQDRLLADISFDLTVGLIASQDGYLLLQRGAPRLPTSPGFFDFVYADPPGDATPVDVAFGDALQLVAFETNRAYADREDEPLLTLYWRVLAPPAEDYLIAVFLLDETGLPVGATLYQQPLTVWWPTSRWEPGETVRLPANTFPWWTGDRTQFGYGVAVVSGNDPWDTAARLPIVRAGEGPAPIDEGTLLPLVRFRRIANIPYAQ